MRFVFNFIFFGLLFYILWRYFPESFQTLVHWAGSLFNYLQQLVVGALEFLKARLG